MSRGACPCPRALTLVASTVAIALWALENTAVAPALELVVDDVLDGGVGAIALNNPAWAPRS